MKIKSLLVFGSMALVGVAFMSCSKENLFDSEAATQKVKAEYEANFVKKYGAIDPNQTWDFSTMEPISCLPSTSNARTRGEGASTSGNVTEPLIGEMTIGNDVITWMHQNMEAGKNNSQKGSPFISVTDQHKFTIVPFYQGCASYFWELWMNVGGKDVKIWTKNEALTYQDNQGNWNGPTNKDGIPLTAQKIKAPTYTFEATPNQTMYFYLKVWTGGDAAYANGDAPTRVSSLDRMMLALDGLEAEANVPIPENNEVTVIGCEDNSKNGSDKDFEDLVFIMYGPKVIHIDEKEVRETKRYMMEDLGTLDDFDFNDLVVDLSIVYKKKITYILNENGVEVVDTEIEIPGSRHQEAIVRAVGGTMKFTIEIGTNTITRWSKTPTYNATDMLNTGWGGTPIYYSGEESELAKFTIKDNDWNPATNNIKVIVEGNGESGEVMTVTFPKKGEAPMMIAVSEDTDWMTERQSVPGPHDEKPWWRWE